MFCKLTRIITRWYALCVRLRVKEKALPSHRMIDLHITLDGVNVVINWFWGHPFHRKLLRILSAVQVLVDFSHQPKVRHFDSVITANQNITSCKVTMNEAFLCEMILKNHEKNKRAQLTEIKIVIFFFFFVSPVLKVIKGVWNYHKQGTQDPSQLQFQMLCLKPFLIEVENHWLKSVFTLYLISSWLF